MASGCELETKTALDGDVATRTESYAACLLDSTDQAETDLRP